MRKVTLVCACLVCTCSAEKSTVHATHTSAGPHELSSIEALAKLMLQVQHPADAAFIGNTYARNTFEPIRPRVAARSTFSMGDGKEEESDYERLKAKVGGLLQASKAGELREKAKLKLSRAKQIARDALGESTTKKLSRAKQSIGNFFLGEEAAEELRLAESKKPPSASKTVSAEKKEEVSVNNWFPSRRARGRAGYKRKMAKGTFNFLFRKQLGVDHLTVKAKEAHAEIKARAKWIKKEHGPEAEAAFLNKEIKDRQAVIDDIRSGRALELPAKKAEKPSAKEAEKTPSKKEKESSEKEGAEAAAKAAKEEEKKKAEILAAATAAKDAEMAAAAKAAKEEEKKKAEMAAAAKAAKEAEMAAAAKAAKEAEKKNAEIAAAKAAKDAEMAAAAKAAQEAEKKKIEMAAAAQAAKEAERKEAEKAAAAQAAKEAQRKEAEKAAAAQAAKETERRNAEMMEKKKAELAAAQAAQQEEKKNAEIAAQKAALEEEKRNAEIALAKAAQEAEKKNAEIAAQKAAQEAEKKSAEIAAQKAAKETADMAAAKAKNTEEEEEYRGACPDGGWLGKHVKLTCMDHMNKYGTVIQHCKDVGLYNVMLDDSGAEVRVKPENMVCSVEDASRPPEPAISMDDFFR